MPNYNIPPSKSRGGNAMADAASERAGKKRIIGSERAKKLDRIGIRRAKRMRNGGSNGG